MDLSYNFITPKMFLETFPPLVHITKRFPSESKRFFSSNSSGAKKFQELLINPSLFEQARARKAASQVMSRVSVRVLCLCRDQQSALPHPLL